MSAPGAQPTILEQAQAIASQTVEQVTALANQAANSQAAHNAVEQAKNLSNQAVAAASSAASTVAATATSLAGQAQAQAHDLAPSVIPAPGTGSTSAAGVDKSSDLKPHSEKDQAKLEKLFSDRPDPKELQEQGILYGEPNDPDAAKTHDKQRADTESKLEKELAHRPAPTELVNKGILNADEAPPAK